MAVHINPVPDDRAERMLKDPAKYFEEARRQMHAEVAAEMAEEAKARHRENSPHILFRKLISKMGGA